MTAVKCVAWDLDGTVWPGVVIESAEGVPPAAFPEALHAMAVLEERGIVNSVVSRTDPHLRELLETHAELQGRFVAPQLGWGHKSEAINTIADELGIATAAIAFVDDNPFERAEVAAVLPDVRVLAPEEIYARLDDAEFRPAVVTADGRHRVERYRQAERRRAVARTFDGTREEFLRSSNIVLTVGPAEPGDVDRLLELAQRTHRFNSSGAAWPADRMVEIVQDPDWFVAAARLVDRFGDYGLVGAAVVRRGPADHDAWRLQLFAVSCRAAGREVPAALLGWTLRRAQAAGAGLLVADVRPTETNLELRVLFRKLGFEQPTDPVPAGPQGTMPLQRSTASDLVPPPWLTLTEQPPAEGPAVGD